MTMNPLPPQAYTKETLLRAYHWLQNQPGSIKEMALTPDILVSLYLKASRDGDHALERPSIQNFKTELKNLAGMMGELESPASAPAPEPSPFFATPPTPQRAPQVPSFFQSPAPTPVVTAPPAPFIPPTAQPAAPVSTPTPPQVSASAPHRVEEGASLWSGTLDAQTKEFLRETREMFNLSSETEALRMLVKIGFESAKGLFPR